MARRYAGKLRHSETNSPALALRWKAQLAGILENRLAYPLVSMLLLVPCYWQPRLQAGDLSSHVYNAWLAQLVERGQADGLVIAGQTTNILFDLMLAALFKLFGESAAQRVSVSTAVLVFVWGAFAFIAAVSGRRPWRLMPCLAMLAYGWVFHMGFFNFYLSLGLCLSGLAVAWELNRWRLAAAAPVFPIAYTAHPLPVLWAGVLLGYICLARRMEPRARIYFGGACLVSMTGMFLAGLISGVTRWHVQQLIMATGADQLLVFDAPYRVLFFGLLLLWALPAWRLLRNAEAPELAASLPCQICILTAMGVAMVPASALLPGYSHALAFIPDRMSLAVAVCICALLAPVALRAFERGGLWVLALLFFAFLFRDERALNAFEDRMEVAVAQLPSGRRVVSGISDPDLRADALVHMLDRVCLRRCFSYANYEPSSGHFRIRTVAENTWVLANPEDSIAMQAGIYVVKPRDLPLYQLDLDRNARIVVKALPAGAPGGTTTINVLRDRPSVN